jgi:DNA-directed RNA polymerase sigma subunit (sigma70/sigma32)
MNDEIVSYSSIGYTKLKESFEKLLDEKLEYRTTSLKKMDLLIKGVLSDKEFVIYNFRNNNNLTLAMIGVILEMPREDIRKVLNNATKKIRHPKVVRSLFKEIDNG